MPEPQENMLEDARALAQSGQSRRALMAFRSLLLIHPELAEAWTEYGLLMLSTGQAPGALEAFTRALALRPSDLAAQTGLGRVFLQMKQLDEAEVLFHQVLSVNPGQTEVQLDLARCVARKGDLERARAIIGKLLEQDPDNPVASKILTDIYIRQENWPDLHREMLRRVHLDHSGVELDWECSCVNLLFGVMPGGWDQHEARFSHPANMTPKREFSQPLWQGESLDGRTLLLHWEQGFGDTLMFVRYAAKVKRLGARVVLLVQPELADLVATCPGVDTVVAEGGALPPFDFHLPLLSLPRLFRTDLATIPAEIPYLEVPGQVPQQAGILEAMAGSKGRTRIGIAWAGAKIHTADARRSIAPELFNPLQALPHVAWYSFQFEAVQEPALPGLVTLGPLLKGFSNTACALRHMDLVITVDTVLAHLAGALGIPTLLLITDIPDWRWLMGRDDSPWYPTIKLYRQRASKDWASVIQRVLQDGAGLPGKP